MTGYTVDLGALRVVAEGIQSVLDELRTLGMNGEQESGSPIENAALSSDDMGSQALAAITTDALQRAHYALRTALHNGGQLVGVLRRIEASYQRTESQVSSLFGQISNTMGTTTDRVPADSPTPQQLGSMVNRRLGGQG
jgi:hypothetical protein